MSTITTQKWLMNRRYASGNWCIHGVANASVHAPLRAANNGTSQSEAFIYLPNGVNTDDYEIHKAGPEYELSRILSPLQSHRADITPISGLYHPNSFGMHTKQLTLGLQVQNMEPTDRNSYQLTN